MTRETECRVGSVAPATSARHAVAPNRTFPIVERMPQRRIVLGIGVELHGGVGQHGAPFGGDRRASSAGHRSEDDEKAFHGPIQK